MGKHHNHGTLILFTCYRAYSEHYWKSDPEQIIKRLLKALEKGLGDCLGPYYALCSFIKDEMAERTGLEPATPGVTGRYSNQLNYRSAIWDVRFIRLMAERTGLEPATPGVTGRYSNQLNYRST